MKVSDPLPVGPRPGLQPQGQRRPIKWKGAPGRIGMLIFQQSQRATKRPRAKRKRLQRRELSCSEWIRS
jgi:hypothetical protein